jgi:hypothetical protein
MWQELGRGKIDSVEQRIARATNIVVMTCAIWCDLDNLLAWSAKMFSGDQVMASLANVNSIQMTDCKYGMTAWYGMVWHGILWYGV